MEVLYTPHFKRDAKRLPASMRPLVEKRLKQFMNDPRHPSLDVHKLHGSLEDIWAFSINLRIRVLFEYIGKDRVVLHAIGDHSIYD